MCLACWQPLVARHATCVCMTFVWHVPEMSYMMCMTCVWLLYDYCMTTLDDMCMTCWQSLVPLVTSHTTYDMCMACWQPLVASHATCVCMTSVWHVPEMSYSKPGFTRNLFLHAQARTSLLWSPGNEAENTKLPYFQQHFLVFHPSSLKFLSLTTMKFSLAFLWMCS